MTEKVGQLSQEGVYYGTSIVGPDSFTEPKRHTYKPYSGEEAMVTLCLVI